MTNDPQLEKVLNNIRDPHKWVSAETILRVIQDNPSLRGFVYGYVSEMEFEQHYLKARKTIESFSKDDDHKKTKSDRTVVFKGKPISIQVKSIQTNSIRFEDGKFTAKVQNDASDRRVKWPGGDLAGMALSRKQSRRICCREWCDVFATNAVCRNRPRKAPNCRTPSVRSRCANRPAFLQGK
ncbi:MAG: hypothetical protein MUF81_06980 [Verrucomicrobia bacterium]|jgi:hypothetical protein|nr:hypothetical protein [Verrucomicrobiota bacterium]